MSFVLNVLTGHANHLKVHLNKDCSKCCFTILEPHVVLNLFSPLIFEKLSFVARYHLNFCSSLRLLQLLKMFSCVKSSFKADYIVKYYMIFK